MSHSAPLADGRRSSCEPVSSIWTNTAHCEASSRSTRLGSTQDAWHVVVGDVHRVSSKHKDASPSRTGCTSSFSTHTHSRFSRIRVTHSERTVMEIESVRARLWMFALHIRYEISGRHKLTNRLPGESGRGWWWSDQVCSRSLWPCRWLAAMHMTNEAAFCNEILERDDRSSLARLIDSQLIRVGRLHQILAFRSSLGLGYFAKRCAHLAKISVHLLRTNPARETINQMPLSSQCTRCISAIEGWPLKLVQMTTRSIKQRWVNLFRRRKKRVRSSAQEETSARSWCISFTFNRLPRKCNEAICCDGFFCLPGGHLVLFMSN